MVVRGSADDSKKGERLVMSKTRFRILLSISPVELYFSASLTSDGHTALVLGRRDQAGRK